MAVTYFDLGANRKLHEVVFAGTHDSGITGGAKNARTQSNGILGQANAGSRIFDLRIAAKGAGKINGQKAVQLRSFHADKALLVTEQKTRTDSRTQTTQVVDRTKFRGNLGEWGMDLDTILNDASAFVRAEPSEFLLLKFDKCTNYHLIADACIALLGGDLYTGGGNLNTKTLDDLKGKVIVLFPVSGHAQLNPAPPGILAFKNLGSRNDPAGGYDPNFDGLQYSGKGGTNATNGKSHYGKMKENIRKQTAMMNKVAESTHASAPEVMGMMYWTTTGLFASIQKRDAKLWAPKRHGTLGALWTNGMRTSMQARLPHHIRPQDYSASGVLKVFMPNFVMVDFISPQRGATIKTLNSTQGLELTQQAILDQEDEDSDD